MIELKDCPFCGAVPVPDPLQFMPTDNPKYACVYPRDCTCGIIDIPDGGRITVEQWNRRTPDRAALVEVARRAIADCRNCDDPACEACTSEASGVVTEYLAEQERTDAAD